MTRGGALQAPILDVRTRLAGVEHALEVEESAAASETSDQLVDRPRQELPMRHGQQQRVEARQLFEGSEPLAVLAERLVRVSERVVHQRIDAELAQLADDVRYLRVA